MKLINLTYSAMFYADQTEIFLTPDNFAKAKEIAQKIESFASSFVQVFEGNRLVKHAHLFRKIFQDFLEYDNSNC